MKTAKVILVSIICLASGVLPAAAQRMIAVPLVEKSPALNGILNDTAWLQGAEIKGFVDYATSEPPILNTSARLLRDRSYLYIGFRCDETNTDSLVANVRDRDGNVYSDDCVEVFLDTNRDRQSYYQIAVNSHGVVADSRRMGDSTDEKWNLDLQVKTGVFKGYWIVEMAIPLHSPSERSLNVSPVTGDTWGLNLCRERYAGEKEYTAWSPTPGGFNQPKNFGLLRFGGKYPTDEFEFDVQTWGELRVDSNEGGGNTFQALVRNNMARDTVLEAKISQKLNGKWQELLKLPVKLDARSMASIALPYVVKGVAGERFAVTVRDTDDGRLAFRTEHPSMGFEYRKHVWEVKKPLFRELLSDTPPGDQQFGTMYWFHSGNHYALRPFALCFGLRYSYDEAMQEVSKNRLMIISNSSMIRQYQFDEWSKKYPFKILFQPDYRSSVSQGAPAINGLPFILDPRSKEAYFRDLRETLVRYRGLIWAVYAQDEPWEKTFHQGVRFFAEQKDTYPFIMQVDEEVKKRFGSGRYGIPTSPSDTNPFRWIAWRRWVNRQLAGWHQTIREEVKKIDPSVRVISMDPVAGHKPYSLDQAGLWCDIMTHQLYPRGNPDLCEFGFVTKLVADLSGKPVWPCTHVENYAFSTTPDEVRELMSQVLRNGGKGYHLYIPDVRGQDAPGWPRITRYGSPERFQAIMETIALTRTMNEVKLPKKAEAALLYSEDTYQSYSAPNNVFPNEIEYAYTFFGPVAERWFRCINDNMVENGRAGLSGYRVLVVPSAKYERKAAAGKIAAWVVSGGTLICGDPEAFSYDLDGSRLTSIHSLLKLPSPGSEIKSKIILITNTTLLPGMSKMTTLPVYGRALKITASANAQVLARYEDGSAAVVLTRVGKGCVLAFGFNPFSESAVGDDGWKQFFTFLADGLKLQREKIWRFQIPPYKTLQISEPAGFCFTGNHVRWFEDKPVTRKNMPLKGIYRFSKEPDAIPDRESGAIAFANGKLTDRLQAVSASPEDLIPQNFAVAWDNPEPVEILFDLGTAALINQVHFWYSGKLPASELWGSVDGSRWVQLSECPAGDSTEDTLDQVLPASNSVPFRLLKLVFGPRMSGQRFTLGEVEIWGQ